MNFFKSIFQKIPFVGKKPIDKIVQKKFLIIKGKKIRVK